VAVAIVGAISVAVAYWQARKETETLLDYQMQQVAHILAGQFFPRRIQTPDYSGAPIFPTLHIEHDWEDDLLATVRDQTGALLYVSRSSTRLPGGALPTVSTLGMHTLKIGAEDYRLFAAESKGLRIEVAQSMEVRREAAASVALAPLLPVVLLLPVLGVVIGLAIRRQLRPLRAAAAAVASRPPLALELLPVDGMPAEVRPLIDEINRLLGRLQTAMQREQRFVTDAAHALRTPLTALQLQADVLDGADDPVEKAARLAELRAGIRRVTRLSEQLLSLARSESATGPDAATTALDPALEEVGAHYQPAAAARGVSLHVEARSAARVQGNARRLTLIFGNLLDNAVRYSPPGGHVELLAVNQGRAARIDVRDEGRGLPPEELERVFERFYRVPGDDSVGSGLGLATVDSLVRQLGGHIKLENRSDRPGLVATVTLPLAFTPQPAANDTVSA
jgi:signal transduction histidine kinase